MTRMNLLNTILNEPFSISIAISILKLKYPVPSTYWDFHVTSSEGIVYFNCRQKSGPQKQHLKKCTAVCLVFHRITLIVNGSKNRIEVVQYYID